MTRIVLAAAVAAALFVPTSASAQNPFTDSVKAQLAQIKNPVIRTADKVGEDLYAFKPTPDVRSLGQLIAHIADGNFGICAAASGMKPPMTGIEKSTQGNGKAALQKALIEDLELKPRKAFGPIRVAVTGAQVSPPLFESMELLGREKSLARLKAAREVTPWQSEPAQ